MITKRDLRGFIIELCIAAVGIDREESIERMFVRYFIRDANPKEIAKFLIVDEEYINRIVDKLTPEIVAREL